MAFPKVSIIIPVYNTEKYVEEAVRSIMNQTLKEIEIIIINDGSTDNSLTIIQKLAKEDPRIQIYSQKNEGQSISRNKGLKIAKGDYIYFMDSDDYLEADALNQCYIQSKIHQTDFIFFDATVLNLNKINTSLNYQHKHSEEDIIYQGIQILDTLIENKSYSPSVCLHFINRAYLQYTKLTFFPHIIHEDELFICLLYLQAANVKYIKQNFFRRRIRENSTMTNKFSRKNMDGYFTVAEQLLEYASNNIKCKSIINKYLYHTLNAAAWLSYQITFKDRMYIAKRYLCDFRKYVSIRNMLILLFKSFIKK